MALTAAPAFAMSPAGDARGWHRRHSEARRARRRGRQPEAARLRHLVPAVRSCLPDQRRLRDRRGQRRPRLQRQPVPGRPAALGRRRGGRGVHQHRQSGPCAVELLAASARPTPRVCVGRQPRHRRLRLRLRLERRAALVPDASKRRTPREASRPTRTPPPGGSTSRPRTAGGTTPRSTWRRSRASVDYLRVTRRDPARLLLDDRPVGHDHRRRRRSSRPTPSWGAGAPSEKAAKQHCVSTPGLHGRPPRDGPVLYQGFDANVRC